MKNNVQIIFVLSALFLTATAAVLLASQAHADTIGVGECFILPNCGGSSIGIMPYSVCVSAGGGAGSWYNQDGTGCYDTH